MEEKDRDGGSYGADILRWSVRYSELFERIRRYGLRFVQRSREVSGKCSSVTVPVFLFNLSLLMS